MILLRMPGTSRFERLTDRLGGESRSVEVHRFPDGERCVRITGPVPGEDAVLLADLRHDEGVLPLLFAAATARDLGAASLGLVSPYLPYLRQDASFRAGAAVTARYFARDARDLRRLAGTWLGEFSGEENDRHGTISFSLAVASDTAYGSVTLEAPSSVAGRIVLRVATLATSAGSVGGWMRPYRDPVDGCWVDTWFEGRITGDSLSGTYFSRHTEAEPIRRGSWWAVRNYTWR